MTYNCPHISNNYFNHNNLAQENQDFSHTTGISENNHSLGFSPAFYDSETKKVYLSCTMDGKRAPIHLLEGLPEELIRERDQQNHIVSVKSSVISGFVKNNQFYTREQAAELAH